MDAVSVALIALAIVAYAVVSGPAEHSPVTPPMVFLALGALAASLLQIEVGVLDGLAELTLVLVLFTDASRIDLSCLRREGSLPMRLLGIGMPLTIGLGAAVAVLLFPSFGWAEALLLSAVLAPTDAALGQAVVSNPSVPVRVRQSLNVESGLNDGIALPVVLVLASWAGARAEGGDWLFWLRFALLAVTLGPLVGGGVSWLGGRVLGWAARRGWINAPFQRLSGLGLALLAYAGAGAVGGNGFIAAFVAGLVLGNSARELCGRLYDFGEAEGQLLTLLVFVAFGATLVPEAVAGADAAVWLYALLSLTGVRMLPVALSLLGAGLRPATHAFLGWFGPRGLASILFLLLVVEEGLLASGARLESIVVCTVLLSTVLHGLSAYPLAHAYGAWAGRLRQQGAEHQPAMELPLRLGSPARLP